ncbi:unnamed protein product, partial [Polarella glacialis]
VLLPIAVGAHDVDGVLRVLLTEQGIKEYSRSVLKDISPRQQLALTTCVPPSGAASKQQQSLRDVLGLTVGQGQEDYATRIQDALRAVNQSKPIHTSELNEFFMKYERYGGNTYHADWDSSQTLGWNGEATGLRFIEEALDAQASEMWAFRNADAPADCPLGMTFNPKLAVSTMNCFFVTELRPTHAEISQRYGPSLNPDQLSSLIQEFEKARAAALALGFATNFASANPAPQVQRAWRKSVGQLDLAFQTV